MDSLFFVSWRVGERERGRSQGKEKRGEENWEKFERKKMDSGKGWRKKKESVQKG